MLEEDLNALLILLAEGWSPIEYINEREMAQLIKKIRVWNEAAPPEMDKRVSVWLRKPGVKPGQPFR